jgi:hypothetical protein
MSVRVCYLPRVMAGPGDNPARRLALAFAGALLLLSVVCNLAFAWRSVTLQREMFAAVSKLQQSNQQAQQMTSQINAIAQDLVGLAQQHPWLIPILQKYGLVRGAQPSQAIQPGSSKK